MSEEMPAKSHIPSEILAPRYAPKEKSVFKEFRGRRNRTREMVEDANNLITKAYMIFP